MSLLRTTLLALVVVVHGGALARAEAPVNTDGASGVALDGFDPVSFFGEGEPANGDFQIKSSHKGATYFFANRENKRAFDAEPDRYAPQYGGFCAFGVAKGALFPVDIRTAQVVDGKLYLNLNPGVQSLFNKDVAGTLKAAQANWPTLAAKSAK
jgi:YHS domain-containing protein